MSRYKAVKGSLLLPMALLGSSHAWAANGDLLSLPLEELAQLDIRVATGTPTPLSAAPAATALLLPADFRAMGAQTVQEALVAVPGLQVSPYSGISGSDRYFLRGISSGTSVQTLILVNGLPMALQGSSAQTPMLKAPIELIERIEVIRGPGSALYGADAFAGVINIITRDAAALQGGEAGARVGSFDTGTAYLAGGGTVGEAQAGVLLSWSGTQGDDRFIPIDVQTLNDIRDGTSASLAPGPVPQGAQRTDLYATLRRGDVSAAFYWNEVWDFDVGQGLAGALDPQGEVGGRHVDGNIRWQRDGVGAWNLEARLSWLHNATRSIEPFRTLPPGAFGNDPATGQPLFPEGLLDDVDQAENDSMLQASALWQGWDKHRLRLGAGATYADFYKSRHRNNYFFSPASPAPLPRSGGLTDISDTPATIVPESDRTGLFVFAQDEWQLAPAWQLTTGLRYDHFSDFGDALTPRLALVWQTTPKFTSKLIYGEAFRAPAFNELYATGNPFALGNRNLEPERLQSMELGFGYRPGTHWNLGLHLYQFEIRDFIDFLPVGGGPALMAQNASHYRGRGVEAEATYRQGRFELRGNVSAQEVKNKDSNDDLGSAPNHQAYLRAGVDLGAQWQAAAQWRHVGSRERQPGDPQAKLEGYTGLDLTLRRAFDARAEVYLVGRNVTDEDQREPGISPVPESIPLPGRSVMVGARVNW